MSGVFWGQVSHFIAAFMFVIPSRCTVFIQNSLSVDLFGLTAFTAVAGMLHLLLFADAVLYSFAVSVVACFQVGIDFLCHCFLQVLAIVDANYHGCCYD